MSIIYGILLPEGATVESLQLKHLGTPTARHAVDGTAFRVHGRVGMGLQSYFTHARSQLECQPSYDPHGNLLTFDGRLDNHAHLSKQLGLSMGIVSDEQLILAAFVRWGESCFTHFCGDWALALWNQQDRTLYLARDHAGTRNLYFSERREETLWSTCIETFFQYRPHEVSLQFARDYVSGRHTFDLTPYEGIRTVPPAHYLRITREETRAVRHWSPLANKEIHYVANSEYDEHFRSVFSEAVRRRVGDRAHPIVAELSGGMDSSSIVCVADQLKPATVPSRLELETLSYYDDSEPAWNERPYFSAVETQRGHTGLHIECSFAQRGFDPVPAMPGTEHWPGATRGSSDLSGRVETLLNQRGIRSIVSGIGGDELLGGVPSALPELADYVASGRAGRWVSKGIEWCVIDRTPLLFKLCDSLIYVERFYRRLPYWQPEPPPWILNGYATLPDKDACLPHLPLWLRLRHRPSAIANCFTWRAILETLPSRVPTTSTRFEYLYPYLDKDLVEFLLQVPNEQLIKPGERRSMMRRALRGIVPEAILRRRRKAYALRGPLQALKQSADTLRNLFKNSKLAEIGVIEPQMFSRCLSDVVDGTTTKWWATITKTALYEIWLQGATHRSSISADEFDHQSIEGASHSLASTN